MKNYHMIYLVFLSLLLASCAAATPKIHLKTGDMNMEVTSEVPVITSVAYSPDAKGAASGSFDGDMSLWDIEAGRLVEKIKMPTGRICEIVYSTDGKSIVTGDSEGFIRFWDAKTGAQTKQFSGYDCSIIAGEITLSSDSKNLLFRHSFWNSIYRLLDVQTGQVMRDFGDSKYGAISPDGRYVYLERTLTGGQIDSSLVINLASK